MVISPQSILEKPGYQQKPGFWLTIYHTRTQTNSNSCAVKDQSYNSVKKNNRCEDGTDWMESSKKRTRWSWIVGCLLLGCCCAALLALAAGFLILDEDGIWDSFVSELREWEEATPWPSPAATRTAVSAQLPVPEVTAVPTPTMAPLPPSRLRQSPPDTIVQQPAAPQATVDLARLYTLHFPPHDYYETAVRLGQATLAPYTLAGPAYRLGDRQTFFLDDDEIEAELVVIGQNAAFWVEQGVNIDAAMLREVSSRLDETLYPRLVALFGQPQWAGVNGSGRFTILHTRLGLGQELGYFSSVDTYPADLFATSNEQEMVYLNVDELVVGSELYYGTLVHEIQHLIQWHTDPNEKVWLDEGLSQLAELYLGFHTIDTLPYLAEPGTSLTLWSAEEEQIDAHYAASYLFLVYFWEQLGETAVQELARHPANGMASVRSVLAGFAPERLLTDFFADWTVANLLDDPDAGPAYYYENLLLTEYPTMAHTVTNLPAVNTSNLPPFGVDYVALDVSGPITLSFAGDTAVLLSSSPPPEGRCYWLAPPMNDTAAYLTGTFDLTGLDQATLTFDTWFDLEPGWDFAYVTISTGGGANWSLLTPHYTNSGEYGPAFTGYSGDLVAGGWLSESIVLDAYVGQVVEIRFEVLTDFAVLGRGFAVDNIAIPELGHFSGAETACTQSLAQTAVEGWQGHGFVATGWQLPQRWMLRLITWGETGSPPTVTPLLLDELNQGEWALDLGDEGGVLMVTAVTSFTEADASYWYSVVNSNY
jgi:immune inhibitor A